MNLFDNQSWNELSRPVRWGKSIRPAMEVLEARLSCWASGAGCIEMFRGLTWSGSGSQGDTPLLGMYGR